MLHFHPSTAHLCSAGLPVHRSQSRGMSACIACPQRLQKNTGFFSLSIAAGTSLCFFEMGIGYVTCFPALTFVCHFNDIQDSSKAKDTLRTISRAKDTAGRKTSNGSLSFLVALGLIFFLVCMKWKRTHMDASRACPISLPFIQYRTHGSRSQNAPKTFHKLFLIYRIPSPTIKNYSTFFLQTISQFSPCVISLNNMFSSHSSPRISHNTLNSRDASKYSIVFTWLDCGDFGLLLLPQIYVPRRVSHIIYQNTGPTDLMSLHVSTSCNVANSA